MLDLMRLPLGILTGVGFLGAGAIFVSSLTQRVGVYSVEWRPQGMMDRA